MYDFLSMDPFRYIRLALEATCDPGTGEDLQRYTTSDEQELGPGVVMIPNKRASAHTPSHGSRTMQMYHVGTQNFQYKLV